MMLSSLSVVVVLAILITEVKPQLTCYNCNSTNAENDIDSENCLEPIKKKTSQLPNCLNCVSSIERVGAAVPYCRSIDISAEGPLYCEPNRVLVFIECGLTVHNRESPLYFCISCNQFRPYAPLL